MPTDSNLKCRKVFVPSIEVIHKWQRENHKNLKAARAMVKSLFIYLGKWNLGVIKK